MAGWVATVVGLPLLAGLLLVAAFRRVRPPVVRCAVLLATGLTALAALALMRREDTSAVVAGEWLPGTGPLGFAAGTSGLSVLLVTTTAACLVLLSAAWNPERHSPRSDALMLVATSAASAALLTDHFLARYAALEVVALCVGLAPLVALEGEMAVRLGWQAYLPLRAGDVAMLVAILILGRAAGTLHIAPALEAAAGLERAQLAWVVAGLTLAAWVKLGGWPFSLWGLAGRRLSLASHAWLYATLVPNLGAYLLYRIGPLLALAGPLQTTLAWLGAGGAALAALVALTQADVRTALVSVGAAQAGLALLAAAAGLQPVLLLWILALTPLRLLLYLAADVAQQVGPSRWRRVAAGLFGLGGLALSAFSLLTAWWLRTGSGQGAGLPIGAICLAEGTVVLGAAWAAGATRRLAWGESPAGSPDRWPARAGWRRWAAPGLLSAVVLTGGLAFNPLSGRIATAFHLALPPLPSLPDLLVYSARTPGLLAMAIAGFSAWLVWRRLNERADLRTAGQTLLAALRAGSAENIFATMGQAIAHGARVGWIIERQGPVVFVEWAAQAVTAAARVLHRWVEQEGLEGLVQWAAQAVTAGARVLHRWVEQEGMEGLLHAGAGTVLGASRRLQRWHTGRLRRNVVWIATALALAVLCLVIWRW